MGWLFVQQLIIIWLTKYGFQCSITHDHQYGTRSTTMSRWQSITHSRRRQGNGLLCTEWSLTELSDRSTCDVAFLSSYSRHDSRMAEVAAHMFFPYILMRVVREPFVPERDCDPSHPIRVSYHIYYLRPGNKCDKTQDSYCNWTRRIVWRQGLTVCHASTFNNYHSFNLIPQNIIVTHMWRCI